MGVGQDSGEGDLAGPLRSVEHLGLEPGELVLQVGEVAGEGLDDARVDVADHPLVGGAEVMRT